MEIATACAKPRNDGYKIFLHNFSRHDCVLSKSFLKFVEEIRVVRGVRVVRGFNDIAIAEWRKIYRAESYKGIKIRDNLGNFALNKATNPQHSNPM